MLTLVFQLWVVSSFVALCIMANAAREHLAAGESLSKMEAFSAVLAVVMPLLLFFALVLALVVEKHDKKQLMKMKKLMRSWESQNDKFKLYTHDRVHGVVTKVEPEKIITELRETMRNISTKDIRFMLGTGSKYQKLNRIMEDALTDELIERELLDE